MKVSNNKNKNIFANIFFGLFSQLVTLIFSFVSRTLFIRFLGSSYLGINGLFSNVLSLLNLAELGFGTAITFDMYKAIDDNDTGRVQALSIFYKKVYLIIGLVILLISSVLLPFVPYLVNGNIKIDINLYVVFILFVLNTSTTYFFSYRTAVISAFQYRRIVDISTALTYILRDFFSIFALFLTKNYYLYLLINILANVVLYSSLHIISNKMFPFLKEECRYIITKSEKKEIFNNVFSLVIYKIGSVILSSTDNVIISIIVDTVAVGILSNYVLITNALKNLLNKIVTGYMATLGIANANNNETQRFYLYKSFRIIIYWIFGYTSLGILLMINDVVNLWLGSKYILDFSIVFAISLYFWLEGCSQLNLSFRTTLGLFKENRFSPVIAAALNVVFSVILGMKFGVFGVLITTSLVRLATYFWIDPYFLYKKKFNMNLAEYFLNFTQYFLVTGIAYLLCYKLLSFIDEVSVISILIKIIICSVVINGIYLIYFSRAPEFSYVWSKIKLVLCRFRKG